MYNRFSPNLNSKHGLDHSLISNNTPYNAIPVWQLLKMTEPEYNAKYNVPAPVSNPIIPHASPK